MEFLILPERTKGERTYGITSIADFGIPLGQIEDYLIDYHQFIDIAKIGIGSAYVTPNLQKKVDLYNRFNIKPYCGGTLFEKCYMQNKLDDYTDSLKRLGIEWIEISNGTVDISLQTRISLIHKFKPNFNVIAEVGSKDNEQEMRRSDWEEEINLLLAAGCKYVITEGRDSGTAGIYSKNGVVKKDIIECISKNVDISKIIFEAPTAKHQMFFINQFGANVNLGNIKLQDVLTLEAQRLGLRSETLFMEERTCNLS
ncbi:phosphosulfolactate synthase [Fredinandcohnia quinoae]|uniref:Phosphosulfolactate synthase n=1 Tax=Fredinandcohnia quinoae TaxID=2918902 RepID=A0AAW5E493_9BACI|nr:phosphosulfolactate synthase [Fredinandcohnia sp. SECRCQ15]MCH1626369.1 phosphosulfolactate synthase [Fredinandcohnia sp. SECRCQ15]